MYVNRSRKHVRNVLWSFVVDTYTLYIITQEWYFTRTGNGTRFDSINMLLELVVKSIFKTMRAARFCNLKILFIFVAEQRPQIKHLKWVEYYNCNIGLILFGWRILIVTLRDWFFWRHLNTQNLLVYPNLRYCLYKYLRVFGTHVFSHLII